MTMEQGNSHKYKQKKSLSRYLLPNKIPNKVGVAVNRTQSAREPRPDHDEAPPKRSMTISKRPLSLNVSNMSPKKENSNFLVSTPIFNSTISNLTIQKQISSPLDRCSSVSENNVAEASLSSDDNVLMEKSISHESVMKEGILQCLGGSVLTIFIAQVLYLIPTMQARQRNFLQGKIGANSLLGPRELDRVFPNREITIFVGTWNMNGHTPPKYFLFISV